MKWASVVGIAFFDQAGRRRRRLQEYKHLRSTVKQHARLTLPLTEESGFTLPSRDSRNVLARPAHGHQIENALPSGLTACRPAIQRFAGNR